MEWVDVRQRGASAHNPQQFILHCCGRKVISAAANPTPINSTLSAPRELMELVLLAPLACRGVKRLGAPLAFFIQQQATPSKIKSIELMLIYWLACCFIHQLIHFDLLCLIWIWFHSSIHQLFSLSALALLGGAIGGATAHNPPIELRRRRVAFIDSFQQIHQTRQLHWKTKSFSYFAAGRMQLNKHIQSNLSILKEKIGIELCVVGAARR